MKPFKELAMPIEESFTTMQWFVPVEGDDDSEGFLVNDGNSVDTTDGNGSYGHFYFDSLNTAFAMSASYYLQNGRAYPYHDEWKILCVPDVETVESIESGSCVMRFE